MRFLVMLHVAFSQGLPGEEWQWAHCGKIHGQVCTWYLFIGCSHMHGQHAATWSTQVHQCLVQKWKLHWAGRRSKGYTMRWLAFEVKVPWNRG
jgi:hypothetical protein